jgi:hypothetical protein
MQGAADHVMRIERRVGAAGASHKTPDFACLDRELTCAECLAASIKPLERPGIVVSAPLQSCK